MLEHHYYLQHAQTLSIYLPTLLTTKIDTFYCLELTEELGHAAPAITAANFEICLNVKVIRSYPRLVPKGT